MSLFINYGILGGAGELELKYYGAIGDVAGAGNYPKALSFASKILYHYATYSDTMYSLDNTFVRTTLASLPNIYKTKRGYMSGGVLLSRAIIGSGTKQYTDDGTSYSSNYNIYSYNSSLTRSALADLDSGSSRGSYPEQPSDAAATSAQVIFVVNETNNHYQPYNNSGTKLTAISSSFRYWTSATTSFNEYGIFAGGNYISGSGYSTYSQRVCCFNNSLTLTVTTMMTGRYWGAATATNKHLMIAGGTTGPSGELNTVEIFNDAFVRQTGSTIPVVDKEPTATALGENIIFITNDKKVTVFNGNLVKVPMTNVTTIPKFNGAVTLDNYAIFLTPSPSIAEVFELS